MLRAFVAVLFLCLSASAATAQSNVWVQVEASRTLAEAQERARAYARRFEDVQGYYLGRGFYGIVIGPYPENTARRELSRLLATGQIPSDSYLQNGTRFEQQFWPIGGGTSASAVAPAVPALPEVNPIPGAQETLREARASEAALTREQRQELQKALAWGGYYTAAIDGSFGRGTRASMQAWQEANLQEPTGVLTTRQRALLLEQYNAVLADLDMQMLRDDTTGIALEVPTAAVSFASYQPPFAQFDATGTVAGARLLLISQPGDTGKLRGLYEVMQSLEVIPVDGDRQFGRDGFFIEGIDDNIHSFTTASLQDGLIKGFTLVWPARDDARRARVLEVMRESFTPLDGVLDPNLVPVSENQAIDMVSGLQVRQPQYSRSGFYVSNAGDVVTSTAAVDGCSRITLDRDQDATVLASYPDLGLALLRPSDDLIPLDYATLQTAVPRLQDDVTVAGYPFGGVLGAATLSFGRLVDLRGLRGEETIVRLALAASEGDAGGPVLDASGAVLGMLLPRAGDTAQALPEDVSFAVKADRIAEALATAGITARRDAAEVPLNAVTLAARARDITVLVSCW